MPMTQLTSIVVCFAVASLVNIDCGAKLVSPEVVEWAQTSGSNSQQTANLQPGDERNMVNLVNQFWEENKLQLHDDGLMQVVYTEAPLKSDANQIETVAPASSPEPHQLDLLKMATPADELDHKVATFELLAETSSLPDTDEQNTDDRLIKYDNADGLDTSQPEPIYGLLKGERNFTQPSEGLQIESPYVGSNSSLKMGDGDDSGTNLTTIVANNNYTSTISNASQRSSSGGSNLIARALNNIHLANQKFSRPPYASNYDNSAHDRTNQLYTSKPDPKTSNQSKPIFDERIDLLEEPANRFDPQGSAPTTTTTTNVGTDKTKSLQPVADSDPKVSPAAALPESAQDLNKRSDPQGFDLSNKLLDRGAQFESDSKPKRFNKFAIHSIDLNPIPIAHANNAELDSRLSKPGSPPRRPITNESNQVIGLFPSPTSPINRRQNSTAHPGDRYELIGNNQELLHPLASESFQHKISNQAAVNKLASNILEEASRFQSSDFASFDTSLKNSTHLHANTHLNSRQQPIAEPVSPTHRYQPNTKRIPSVSSQANQIPVLWPRQPMNSSEVANQQPDHYSASLINVTAPMILPLSASESMEADAARLGIPATMINRLAQPAASVQQQEAKNEHADASVDSIGRSTSATPSPWRQQPTRNQVTSSPGKVDTNSSLESARLDGSSSDLIAKSGSIRPHHHQQASGFRSPIQQSQTATHITGNSNATNWSNVASHPPSLMPSNYWASPSGLLTSPTPSSSTSPAPSLSRLSTPNPTTSMSSEPNFTTNGFVTADHLVSGTSTTTDIMSTNYQLAEQPSTSANNQQNSPNPAANPSRPRFNMTRVEHISAECSNDLIRTVIIFNGTFKGIIYSSGYVRDPDCLYINGTGKTRYDFSIRLNQCGTLGRQEVHSPTGPNDIRRRDQLMWNTLSIQYNPMIEQEWDEHFRVSCEYGSDFWKTISFNPFNVETNTGSPVLFTVNPPQCQMEVRRGHNMVGPRQEAVLGPVTVGDPLTLLIHMKSEKAGYDILVRNCVAHNGGHQKMQLIDSNGCVVNERFISPFRGTYNDQDMKQVTLYAYLKAFRFTGSPVLYLECEIHMCQSACPPQMCYWRQLSKRSADYGDSVSTNDTEFMLDTVEPADARSGRVDGEFSVWSPDESHSAQPKTSARQARHMRADEPRATTDERKAMPISDSVSLYQALEVRQEHDADFATGSYDLQRPKTDASTVDHQTAQLICYRQAELLAYLFGLASIVLVAVSVSIGCCWRASQMRKRRKLDDESVFKQQRQRVFQLAADSSRYSQSANLSQARYPANSTSQCHVHRAQNRSSPTVSNVFS